MDKKDVKNLWLFFTFSYLMFWGLLALTGILISLKVPTVMQDAMKNISAWSPTFVLLVLFKRLFPGRTMKDFMKTSFGSKAKPLDFILSSVLQVLALVGAVCAYLIINNESLHSLVFINLSTALPVLLMTITAGPLGEELGWRGYALGILQRRHSPFWASLILGLVWGFWHLPLWLLTGYSGIDLLIYIVAFLVGTVSTSILIAYFYNRSRNVLIAIWIHFCFNFLFKIVIIDILPMLLFTSIGYLLIALAITTLNHETMMRRPGAVHRV